MVYTVVALQQLLVSLLSLLTATDTGILCPGLSVTRWFLHTDVYSQVPTSPPPTSHLPPPTSHLLVFYSAVFTATAGLFIHAICS